MFDTQRLADEMDARIAAMRQERPGASEWELARDLAVETLDAMTAAHQILAARQHPTGAETHGS